MIILAFETSCDETAAAVVQDGRTVRSSVVASQIDAHAVFGGVVPEIAGRMHMQCIAQVHRETLAQAKLTLDDIDAVAVTHAPGLVGALLVGLNFAKGLAYTTGKPLIAVHHLRAHVAANYLTHRELEPPFLCLIASGGHTHIVHVQDHTTFAVMGKTRDDAAGEALDKTARMLGLPYPGGMHLDKLGEGGDPKAYTFPRPKVDGVDFSFSGLKTAARNAIHNAQCAMRNEDFAASFQLAVANYLCDNTLRAAAELGCRKIALAGGVCANSVLRAEMQRRCAANQLDLFMPELRWCGDNAAMVGAQAFYEHRAGNVAGKTLNALPNYPI
ncbi:MAG: tRNA (adenosine(37)-N6)-threonylcarbamoyltransferase complex transferase subunit TsaD [Oscillospiraceae bacterium]|nr:tRNA (adenosine(37)-N6)-threonylcarbamoyltransferase complex transferase subunit TsaD [Oscillospiraceae bacterium]